MTIWLQLAGRIMVCSGLLCSALTLTAASATLPYALEHRLLGHDRQLIRVYNRRTGHTIWTRTVREAYLSSWSADGRALAVVDIPMHYAGGYLMHRLILWRVGERIREFRAKPPRLEWDSIAEVAWSPYNQRLLVLEAPGMGNASVGSYELWCLRMTDLRIQRVTPNEVGEAKWIGRRRIRYRVIQEKDRRFPEPRSSRRVAEDEYERNCR